MTQIATPMFERKMEQTATPMFERKMAQTPTPMVKRKMVQTATPIIPSDNHIECCILFKGVTRDASKKCRLASKEVIGYSAAEGSEAF